MWIMHAPHCPAPQPKRVPVSFSSSRSTQSSGVLSGASTLTGLPFTVKAIAMGDSSVLFGGNGGKTGSRRCYARREKPVKGRRGRRREAPLLRVPGQAAPGAGAPQRLEEVPGLEEGAAAARTGEARHAHPGPA